VPTEPSTAVSTEQSDLLQTLATHRGFLLRTVHGLTDAEAAAHPTTSELCLGGILKHVALVEERWCQFVLEGPSVLGSGDVASREIHAAGFRMLDEDSLAALVARYEEVARHTDELIASLPSLDVSQPLPQAPWFEPGARWSARRVLLHIIAETAQHAGHADIIRESIDGAKTMG
jgi:hypothetical protein